MSKEVTLYRFYLKSMNEMISDVNERMSMNYSSPPYAFTRDKSLAKRFKKERNMDRFIVLKDTVTVEKYAEFCAHFQPYLIYLKDLYMPSKNDDGLTGKYVNVITTEMELIDTDIYPEDRIIETTNFDLSNSKINPLLLNNNIISALDAVCYMGFWRITNDVGDDSDTPNMTLNEFEIYLDNILPSL